MATTIKLLVLTIVALLLVIPFTPFAGRIQHALERLVAAAGGKREVITREVTKEITKEVQVPYEVTKEIVKEVKVEVPAPPTPLPDKFIARKDVDVASLFNGITVKTKLLTEQGDFASLERLSQDAYKAEFQLSIRVPKANQSVQELARINPKLPTMLPDLGKLVEGSRISGFYHKLYENKTAGIQRDLTRLNKVLDRHNFFDCETILEMSHPTTKRKVLLVQSEMDVVADGSDGDRMPTLDDYISLSDYYQPFTSYGWPKQTKTPNPLLARWEARLKTAKDEFSKKGLSAARNRELKAIIGQIELEIREMKNRSSLIAEKDPFIVISLLFRPYQSSNPYTPQIGDYAVVLHEGKLYPAICGDYGPTMKMGEASLFMAKAINEKATPYRRPESDLKVSYLIFPGTADKPNTAPNLDRWYERCAALLTDLGGVGTGYELHRWENPFKPVTPDPIGGLTPTGESPIPTVGAGGTTITTTPSTPAPAPAAGSPATPAPGSTTIPTVPPNSAPTTGSGTTEQVRPATPAPGGQ